MTKFVFFIFCTIFPQLALSLTLDDVSVMRRSGVQIKLSNEQRDFTSIPEAIRVDEFLSSDAISFENIPVHTLPDFIFDMHNLREVVLKNTDLRVSSVIELNRLTELERVDISDNDQFFVEEYKDERSCQQDPSIIGTVFGLESCAWVKTYRGPRLADIMLALPKLKILDVSNIGRHPRQTWELSIEVSQVAKLVEFRAKNSGYSFYGGGKESVFANMPLHTIDISGSQISAIDSWFCEQFDFENVKWLSIADSGIPYLDYCDFPALEYWDVSGNPIKRVNEEYKGIFALSSLVSLRYDTGQTEVADFACSKLPNTPECDETSSASQADDLVSRVGDSAPPIAYSEEFGFPAIESLWRSDDVFSVDSAYIKTEYEGYLKAWAENLIKFPNSQIIIVVATDNTGSADYNSALSSKRANNIREYIIALGVDSDRVLSVGYGEDYPVASNMTPEGRAENRYIKLQITPIYPE